MSRARDTVEEILTEALGDTVVAQNNRSVAWASGRVWVLMGAWARSTEGPGETVAVVCAAPAGHHERLDSLVDEVFTALRTDGRCDPTSFNTAYGVKEAVPGRSPSTPGDMASIVVNTPFDR